LHYNCDHISSLAAHTASDLLSRATAPYVLALAKGLAPAIQAMPSLAGGVMCRGGALTHRVSAENKGLPWKPLEDVMGTDGGR
jgi:alanine dehydrogenase